MNEIWKDVLGFEGRYQVSNIGNVRSILFGRTRPKQSYEQGSGYRQIKLHADNKTKHYQLHRVIVEAFIRPMTEGEVVNHKNGNPSDNSLGNLEIVTVRENTNHGKKVSGKQRLGARETDGGKFTSSIRVYGKLIHLGTFTNLEDAQQAYVRVVKAIAEDKYGDNQ